MRNSKNSAFSVLLLTALTGCGERPETAAEPVTTEQTTPAEPSESADVSVGAEPGYPTQVYWGDTHLHTSYSFDVYLFGTPASTPETAYRFARGEAVENPTTGAT